MLIQKTLNAFSLSRSSKLINQHSTISFSQKTSDCTEFIHVNAFPSVQHFLAQTKNHKQETKNDKQQTTNNKLSLSTQSSKDTMRSPSETFDPDNYRDSRKLETRNRKSETRN